MVSRAGLGSKSVAVLFLILTLFGSTDSFSLQKIPFGFFRKPSGPTVTDKLVFTTSAQTVGAGDCSAITTVQSQNAASAALNVGSNLTVNLGGASGISYYSDSTCLTPITSVTIASGSSTSPGFYFISDISGTRATSANAAAYITGTQNQTINANAFMWTGGGADANWDTALNWSGGAAPSTTSHTAYFVKTCASNCSPTINTNVNIGGIKINQGFPGTITQASTRTITLAAGGWTQKGGTFAGGDSAVTVNGSFALTGGTFTSTSATLTIYGTVSYTVSGSPTFNHNSGTVTFSGAEPSTMTIIPGTVTYNHVTFAGDACTQNLTGTMTVNGNLTLADIDGTPGSLNTGTIDVKGNLTASTSGKPGTALIKMTGSGNQTITGTATSRIPNLEISSTGGTVTLSGTLLLTRDYIYNTGVVSATGSTLQFTGDTYSQSVVPGTVAYNNVTFAGDTVTSNLTGTMTVNGTLTLADVDGTSGWINSGTIEARGDIAITNQGKYGTALIKVVGSSNQTITSAATGRIPNLEIASTGGTVTYSGTLNMYGNYTVTSGSIDPTTSTINFLVTSTITPGTATHTNVSFGGTANTQTISGTLTVNGTLTLANTSSSGTRTIDGGTINANGNVALSSYGKGGTTNLTFGGSTSTTLTAAATALRPAGTITVNKTGGTSVSLLSLISFNSAGQDFTITSGTFNMAGFNLTVTDVLTVGSGTTLICNGGTLLPGSVSNSGSINCLGYGQYDFNWTGTTTDGNWNTAGNWYGGVAPNSTKIVAFDSAYCGANCNATINVNSSVAGVRMYAGYAGTITQATGITFSVGASGFQQSGGTFAGGDSNITFSGASTLNGGTFTSTAAALIMSASLTTTAGNTFNHNNGTVLMNTNATGITTTTLPLYHFKTSMNQGTLTFSGTIQVNGDLTIESTAASGWFLGTLTGGILDVRGNVSSAAINANNCGFSGTTQILFSGSANQTYSQVNTGCARLPAVRVNKTGGTLTVANTMYLNGGFIHTAGTIDWTTTTLSLIDMAQSVTAGTTTYNNVEFWCAGCTMTISGTMNVAGNLRLVTNTTSGVTISGGGISVAGNVTNHSVLSGGTGYAGSTVITFSGSNNQTYAMSNTTQARMPNTVINKSGGTLTFNDHLYVQNGYTYTAGTVDWTTKGLYAYDLGQTISPGAITYPYGGVGCNGCTITVSGTWNIAGDLYMGNWGSTTSSFATLNGGTINVGGNVTNASVTTNGPGFNGTTDIVFNGTGNQSYTATNSNSARVPKITVNKASGTLTINNTLLTRSGFVYTAGTVSWGSSHLFAVDTSQTITPGSLVFNNVTFGATGVTYTINGTMNISGNLYLQNWATVGGSSITMNSGALEVAGNVDLSGGAAVTGGYLGSTILRFVGSGAQTISTTTATSPNFLTIEKTGSGTVTQTKNIQTGTSRPITISAGTWDMAGFNLQASSATMTNNGILRRGTNPSCGTLSYSTYSGTAAICP